MSVKVVEIHRVTKPLIKYPPCSEIGASICFEKFPWHKLKLARVRNVCEVEINFDPKSWPLENLFSCNFWSITV